VSRCEDPRSEPRRLKHLGIGTGTGNPHACVWVRLVQPLGYFTRAVPPHTGNPQPCPCSLPSTLVHPTGISKVVSALSTANLSFRTLFTRKVTLNASYVPSIMLTKSHLPGQRAFVGVRFSRHHLVTQSMPTSRQKCNMDRNCPDY
jgi:hypothetical protein